MRVSRLSGPSLARRRAVCAAAAALLVTAVGLSATSVFAQSLSSIRGQAQQINSEWRQLSGQSNAAAEGALIERLGKLVVEFIAECDRAAQTGTEEKEEGALRPVFDALYEPLNGIYKSRSDGVERMAREVMDADGDLDALYESRQWQESQTVAAQSLYYLNWLDYYGSRLYDGARRKELLEAAERGFSQFAVGDRKNALLAESLLGRGLCNLDLGQYEWAIRDFKLVIENPDASPERKSKARIALLNAYARAASVKQTSEYVRQLLDSSGLDPRDRALVSYYQLQMLLKAAKSAPPATAEQYRREAKTLMDELRRAGPGWAGKVDALLASVDDPAQFAGNAETPAAKWQLAKMLMQKGDDAKAKVLMDEILANKQPDAQRLYPEVNYWLGVADFKAGKHAAAADRFDAALNGAKGDLAADAAYWRFKALEAMVAQQEDEKVEQRYVAAMTQLLEAHPNYKLIYEPRYRMGEYLQANEKFEEAMTSYEKVSGDPGYELRASFGLVQCDFELLKERTEPQERAALLKRIETDLARFDQLTQAYQATKHTDVPLKDFQAKVTILRAVYVSLATKDGDAQVAEILADYGRKYPEQPDLLAQAVRIRLEALLGLGRYTDAEKDVASSREALQKEGRGEALEKIAVGYMKGGARREADGDAAGAKAANQVALQLYEIVAALDGGGNQKTKLAMARLSESTNPERAAALYKELEQSDPGSALSALRGLARVAEKNNKLNDALGYWKQYTAKTTPGDPPWYDGQYQQARLTLALGDKAGSCKMLTDLRPAMPGLGDATLRKQLSELYEKAC